MVVCVRFNFKDGQLTCMYSSAFKTLLAVPLCSFRKMPEWTMRLSLYSIRFHCFTKQMELDRIMKLLFLIKHLREVVKKKRIFYGQADRKGGGGQPPPA